MNFLTIDTDTGKAGDDADDARPADPRFCHLAGSADPRTSGDLACADERGCYRITGRLKDMIIRGGENVYPREIEEYLFKLEGIADVQVVGVPSRRYGEEVGAFIKLKKGAAIQAEDVKDFCRGRISRYKIPKHVAFVDAYPMTASGKIQKFKLVELSKTLFPEEDPKP